MSTQKIRLTVVRRAAAQAQSAALTLSELLDLYLATPSKQREEQFVSTARAAEIADVSRRTIQSWIDCGDLSVIRIGKCYKISLDSLRGFLWEGIADHGPLIRGGDLNRGDAEERWRNTE